MSWSPAAHIDEPPLIVHISVVIVDHNDASMLGADALKRTWSDSTLHFTFFFTRWQYTTQACK